MSHIVFERNVSIKRQVQMEVHYIFVKKLAASEFTSQNIDVPAQCFLSSKAVITIGAIAYVIQRTKIKSANLSDGKYYKALACIYS